MKTLRQLCAAVILTLAIVLSASAEGQIGCPAAAQPPPAPTADGQIGCPAMAQSVLLTLETVFLLS
ncbi:MAG: hypothetical protein WBP93_05790 [Pyrinomonadaceae bacterium]